MYESWQNGSGFRGWWKRPDRGNAGHGGFQETFLSTIDRFEAVCSGSANPKGDANMQEKISGELEEHAYWGSMRAASQLRRTNELRGEK
jgi:hypothetical protein